MAKFDGNKVMPRYFIIVAVLILLGVAVVGRAAYIMVAERDYWTEVASRLKKDSVSVAPARGNILTQNGDLMASSLPEYKIYMDFKTGGEKKDSIWNAELDSICRGLSHIFPKKSAEEFRAHLEEGHQRQSRNWPIWSRRIDYNTFRRVQELPVFCLPKFFGGFHYEEFNARKQPYGSLAKRTIGDMYGALDSAKCGLELAYDSVLRGTPGLNHRRKVLNKYMNIPVTPPIDGCDIVTTIDVGIQDLAERALLKMLKEPLVHGDAGVAIVMEVATGDIKAMVNMTKCGDGEYYEIRNGAVSNLLEPGSVFKTASIMVALDDGVVDTTYRVDTGYGVWKMYGRDMKDHNWRRGGYGVISLPRTLEVSSNIGVSRIIDDHYHSHPEKYVEGIYRTGLADDLQVPIPGSTPARIRMPRKNSHGQYTNWSNTALAWMSIGYETQVPPLSTLTFYNAIANDGRMMRPRFITKAIRDGEVVEEYPPVCMRDSICKRSTVKTMQTILEHVVSQGLGKKAGSKFFKVAGKTGTAQISQGAAGYKSGTVNYLLSFAGFFPADKPLYSCIVCIQKSGLPASGGGMSGVVFHEIAEGIMARYEQTDINDLRAETSGHSPSVLQGDAEATTYVMKSLGIDGWQQAAGAATLPAQYAAGCDTVPDVRGMGARDAVFILESLGIRTRVEGIGAVKSQSLRAGEAISGDQVCILEMSQAI